MYHREIVIIASNGVIVTNTAVAGTLQFQTISQSKTVMLGIVGSTDPMDHAALAIDPSPY